MPRQFAFRGDRLAYSWGIVVLAGGRRVPDLALQRRRDRADPALLGRRVRLLHAQPDRDGHATGGGSASPAGSGGRRSTRFGAVLTAVVLVVVVSVKFVDGAYLVVILIPILVAMMLFIHRQYDASRRELAVRPRLRRPRRRSARSGSSSRSRASTGRSSRRSTSGGRSPTTSGRSSSPTTPTTSPPMRRSAGSASCPGVPLVVVESPYRALVGPLDRLPRRARRRLAARQDRRRSRSSSCPSTSPAAGGSGSSTTSR